MGHKRKLAAVLSADVAGYARLMEAHEASTVAQLDAARAVFREHVAAAGGRVVDTAGDSVLATFDSAVSAVRSALDIQRALAGQNAGLPPERAMAFRIGINLGEILEKDDGTVYGDGVNIAARLEALAEPGGVCVSGNIRDVCAVQLELAEEDLGEQRVHNIRTPVRAVRIAGAGERVRPLAGADPSGARPTVAVLPFDNVSGDPGDDYLADGIAEDIITELSRFRSLVVIARNSAFAQRDPAVARATLAAGLGARYLVHGTVRRAGTRVRVTASLTEVASQAELWAERFDRQLDDVFAIQDEIADHVVSVLPARIEAADLRRIQSQPTESLAAWESLLKGKFHHHRMSAEDNRIALELLERAIELDPGCAQAHAWKACTVAQAWVRGYGVAEDEALQLVMESLATALSLDEDDFETHRILSGVHLVRRDFERAAYHAARAFELNPNDPRVMSQYGEILTAMGRAEDAIVVLEQALEVDPHEPDRRLRNLATAEFVARRYRQALDRMRRVAAPDAVLLSYVAACHAQLEELVPAARAAARVRALMPEFDAAAFVDAIPYAEPDDRVHHIDALSRAGLSTAA